MMIRFRAIVASLTLALCLASACGTPLDQNQEEQQMPDVVPESVVGSPAWAKEQLALNKHLRQHEWPANYWIRQVPAVAPVKYVIDGSAVPLFLRGKTQYNILEDGSTSWEIVP